MKTAIDILLDLGYTLKPLKSETYLRLFVEGDENDGDYISKTYDFKFEEYEKVLKIQKALLELDEMFITDFDWENDNDKYKDFDITDYIPSGSQEFVHTISEASIEICINGKKYEVFKTVW